ncbi:hypothetical protein ONS95_003996 [Cadophora gregata]|uniref:uncharacterized protein n=1 Tax=Cadophora gregata TaxID=51156 RepID=UPI0026DC64D2|nr:uncharacterized protein ONS95_003996 [Cadophora gregata]KAK0107298.1 hypothetical protein ONS95_003996 [Cadophora gregata]KAK0116982.1 hypothetical protein ONS96_012824 [Cadophora gregata f. sp. sojae]
MSSPSSTELIHAYRQLYRGLLHAVQFSKPSRYIARDQLRNAFRKGDPTTFDQQKVTRTVEFLNYAAQERGLEHRIIKNLFLTKYWEKREEHVLQKMAKLPAQKEIRRTARTHYEMTLAMLNDSMGLCLR